MILLDKDGILPKTPKPPDEDYRIRKPSQDEFRACCNEFWWYLNNITKGLWREGIPYIHKVFYGSSHPQLVKLLNWKMGYEISFQASIEEASKNLKAYLPEEIWGRFLKTYVNDSIDDIWRSVFIMCSLFHDTASELEKKWGHTYHVEKANASYGSLERVRSLPKSATAIFDKA